MASDDHQKLHILLLPLMTQSHIIPFTDMARLLAQRGPTVTILMTPLNALRFKTLQTLNPTLEPIHVLSLPFHSREAGLPQGCETLDSLPSTDLIPSFYNAVGMLQDPLEKWIEDLPELRRRRPDCLISDFCLPWTRDVALKFDIPRYVFHGTSCFAPVCNFKIAASKILDLVESDSEPFSVPGIPDKDIIEFTRAQLPLGLRRQSDCGLRDRIEQFKASELSSDGILMNTVEELEPKYVQEYSEMKKKTIWCIGPVNSHHPPMMITECPAMKWLDERAEAAGSVVYACFGSLSHMSASQLEELALGLELSNRPFVWVGRFESFDGWLSREGFEERVKGQGLLVRGWAPQARILGHAAVGGFLTHCGWNSTLEGVLAGRAMVTWPMFAEQFHNEKMIVGLMRIGVRVGAERTVEHGVNGSEESGLVGKEKIRKAVEELMSEGGEAEERRRRARELGEMARRAVEEGGSSYLNLSHFLDHVSEKSLKNN